MLNVPSLSLVAARLLGESAKYEHIFILVACVLALIVNYIWFRMTRKAAEWIEFWNKKLGTIEKRCGAEGNIKVFDTRWFHRIHTTGMPYHSGLLALSLVFASAWAMLLIVAIVSPFLRGVVP